MAIKIILLIFILFVLNKIRLRYRQKELNKGEMWLWLVFWLIIAAVVVWPQKTDVLAQILGVGRGADLLVYISILALFYLVFRVLIRVKKMDQEITKIVKYLALKDEDKDQ